MNKPSVLLLVCFVCMALPGIRHGLWRPDEYRVAGICAEMARTGDLITPRLNGKPFLEKPPLYFAVGALFGRVFGQNRDISYRLVSLLFAMGTLGLTCLIARQRLGNHGGWCAAGILASTAMFFRVSRWIQVDMALVFAVTLAMYSYLQGISTSRKRYSVLLALGIGMSFMVKGFVGPVLIGTAILADGLRLKRVTCPRPLLILLIAMIPAAGWIAALYCRGGWPQVREVIVVNNLMRFAGIGEGAALGHQHGVQEYLEKFPQNFLPWTFLFLPAFVRALRNCRNNPYVPWFAAPFLVLCLASTKRDVYLLPLYPAAACMLAEWLPAAKHSNLGRAAFGITWVSAIALGAGPLAGIWLGQTIRGIVLGLCGAGSVYVLFRGRWGCLSGLSPEIRLVWAVNTGLFCASLLYFSCRTPHKDCLAFARDALAAAQGGEITILCPDETMDGVLPFAAGRNLPEVTSVTRIVHSGLYAWMDSRDRILNGVQTTGHHTDILIQRELGGHKRAILARIEPGVE